MRIWLIHVGELLPIDGNVRLFRYGILAEMLAERGHTITRWSPTFVHAYKRQRFTHDESIWLNPNYRIELLYAEGYARNVSLQRVSFHRRLERALERRINHEPSPDVILSGIPTPGMCLVALRYAQKHGIPFVIDVRDLWPDIYLTIVPEPLRKIARWALWPAFRTNLEIFRGATAIFGVSESYLNWGLGFANRVRSEADGVFPLGYPEPNSSAEEIAHEKRKLLDIGVNPQKTICCFFGQFEATYDLETVITAARLLDQTGEDRVQFVLCGNGTKRQSLRKQAEGLANIVFPGWVSAPAIQALIQMSKIGLAAYSAGAPQSLPNKPIEYLAGGLPVLSSLTGELEQVLSEGGCGITYAARDAGSLARNVRFLIKSASTRGRMSQNAYRVFKDRFSATRVYPAMIDRLEKIAHG